MKNELPLSKVIENKIYELFEKLVAYSVTNTIDNQKLKTYFDEEYNKLLDYLDETLVNYFHAKADINASLSTFIKSIIPKYAAKRAIIRYLFSKERSNELDIELIRVLCQAFGFSPAKVLPDNSLFRFFSDIIFQYYRVKGTRQSIELILRIYTSSPRINIFDVYWIKPDEIQLRTVQNNQYIKFNTGKTLFQLQQETNSWWFDKSDSIKLPDLPFHEYKLPYIGISIQDVNSSIKNSFDVANNILLHLLTDPNTTTTFSVLPSLNVNLTIKEHVVLYILITQLLYDYVYNQYGTSRNHYPKKLLFYYALTDISNFSRPQAVNVITNILVRLSNLTSATAYNVAQIIYDHYTTVQTLNQNSLESFIITNYPVTITPDIISEIHDNIVFIHLVVQNLESFILAYVFNLVTEEQANTVNVKSLYNVLKTQQVNTLYTEIENTINGNISLADIIYMVGFLLNNNLMSLEDGLALLSEIEFNILSYINNSSTFIVDSLYPLLLVLPHQILSDDNFRSILEIIKPVHVKTLFDNITVLLGYVDRDVLTISEGINIYGKLSFNNNPVDLTCPDCTSIKTSVNYVNETTDPSYPIAPTILNYRQGYVQNDFNWVIADHGLTGTYTFDGYLLDSGLNFDGWTSGYDSTLGTNSLLCGRCPNDLFQLIQVDTTTNSLVIVSAKPGLAP